VKRILIRNYWVFGLRILATNCVHEAFLEKLLAKHRPYTMVRGSEGLHSLDVVWVFMENSADKGNTDTFSSCNSLHTGPGFFFHSSQYKVKTSSYLNRH
jgi:hypothetical protein